MDFSVIAHEADAAIFSALADAASLDGRPVPGMFRAPWLRPQMGGMATGIVEPHLVIRDGDLDAAGQGSTVVVDGRSYTVVSVEPDGTGITTLVLREDVL